MSGKRNLMEICHRSVVIGFPAIFIFEPSILPGWSPRCLLSWSAIYQSPCPMYTMVSFLTYRPRMVYIIYAFSFSIGPKQFWTGSKFKLLWSTRWYLAYWIQHPIPKLRTLILFQMVWPILLKTSSMYLTFNFW